MVKQIPRFEVRVYWEDTDASGIVYHANYVRFLERARSQWARSIGMDQHKMLTEQFRALVVANLEIDFKRPARLDDTLTIETHLTTLRAASFVVEQRVLREQAVLATARVRLGLVDTKSGHPVPFDQELIGLFKPYLNVEETQNEFQC